MNGAHASLNHRDGAKSKTSPNEQHTAHTRRTENEIRKNENQPKTERKLMLYPSI